MSNDDFSPEENEFRREIEPALATLRADAGRCPHPDLLMAFRAGVLPEHAEAIEQHLGRCSVCRRLSADLTAYEYPGATADEDRRIRARWTPRTVWRVWAAAAAIVLLVGLGIELRVARKPAPAESVATREPAPLSRVSPSSPAHSLLALEKAPIRLPAAAVLIYRGDSSANEAMLKALAAALQPYGTGDYAEAARRLKTLSEEYADSAEASYYLGVSLLFLNDNQRAVDSLMAARSHQDESLADSVTWYLAVALNHAGRDAEAGKEAASLCSKAGEFQQKACAAVEELKVR